MTSKLIPDMPSTTQVVPSWNRVGTYISVQWTIFHSNLSSLIDKHEQIFEIEEWMGFANSSYSPWSDRFLPRNPDRPYYPFRQLTIHTPKGFTPVNGDESGMMDADQPAGCA